MRKQWGTFDPKGGYNYTAALSDDIDGGYDFRRLSSSSPDGFLPPMHRLAERHLETAVIILQALSDLDNPKSARHVLDFVSFYYPDTTNQ